MSRWPSLGELAEHAAPLQRAQLERRLGRAPVLPAPVVIAAPAGGPVMNKTEQRYHDALRAQGLHPRFAALTLCLTSFAGRRVRYTPDFVVATAAGVELHEVKGAHVYEDARIKFQFAVEEWGQLYAFVWSQWAKGEWHIRRHERR